MNNTKTHSLARMGFRLVGRKTFSFLLDYICIEALAERMMTMDNENSAEKKPAQRRSQSDKKRKKNLMLAADSAINRLEELSRPGGEIENMDIKELKNLISSIKELVGVSLELSGSGQSGGVVVLPEVSIND